MLNAMQGVIQMMKPPQALLSTSLIGKVARHALRKFILQPAQGWLSSSHLLWPAAMKQ